MPWILLLAAVLLGAGEARAGEVEADYWVTHQVQYPAGLLTTSNASSSFKTLHAESLAGSLKVLWQPEKLPPHAAVTLYASADELGHWPAREWRCWPMVARSNLYEATVPVEDIEVPLVYFISVGETSIPERKGADGLNTRLMNNSPMRVCYTHRLGLQEPTQVFWAFLEGFEQGSGSWQIVAPGDSIPTLQTASTAHSGASALLVQLPERKRSVTVATTQLRGWQLQRHEAIGIRLWLRTRTGSGRARFTLLSNAYSAGQAMAVWPRQFTLNDQWQKIDLFFSEVPEVPLRTVDLFAVDLIGKGPCEFLMDDLQLLGPWKLQPD